MAFLESARCVNYQAKDEERFLSAQADHSAGAEWKEKASACSIRNDGGGGGYTERDDAGLGGALAADAGEEAEFAED